MKNVILRPNSSRIRSDKPLPVIAPMRAAISCTTINATVVGTSVQSRVYPYFRAGLRIGEDPARVVVDVGCNEPGSNNGKQCK